MLALFRDSEAFTARLQYALIVLAAIVTVAVGVRWNERLSAVRADISAAQSELAELKALKSTDIWERRLVESRALRQTKLNQLWQGASYGVIAAEIEQGLRDLMTAFGVSSVRIEVDPEPMNIGTLDLMAFRLSANVPGQVTPLPIIIAIAESERLLFVDEVRFALVAESNRPTRFTLSGYAPTSLKAPETASDDGGNRNITE